MNDYMTDKTDIVRFSYWFSLAPTALTVGALWECTFIKFIRNHLYCTRLLFRGVIRDLRGGWEYSNPDYVRNSNRQTSFIHNLCKHNQFNNN